MTDTPAAEHVQFSCEPDPDYPGWHRWSLPDPTLFLEAVLGHVLVRAEGEDTARVRLLPQRRHTNSANNIHGGLIMGLIDVALFAAFQVVRGVSANGSATVDISTQFIGAGDPSKPLDAVVEVLRETRRLGFLRGLVVQDDAVVASFSGTVRKPSTRA